jgi:hypothetical protein
VAFVIHDAIDSGLIEGADGAACFGVLRVKSRFGTGAGKTEFLAGLSEDAKP